MASISEFISALRGGGARPNRFEVVIDFPVFATSQETIRQTPFLVHSTSLPGSTLGVVEVPFRGRQIKLPGDRVFDEWSVTFFNDTDFGLRNALEAWHNGINQYNLNIGTTLAELYMGTATVYQLDTADNRIKQYTMRHVWPSVVAPVELAQDSNDQVEMFETTFVYSDLVIPSVIGGV